MAKLAEQFTVVSEIDAQNLWQSEYVLSMRDGRKNVAAQQLAELDGLFGVTAWTEPAPLAAEGEQVLMAAIGAAHTSEPFTQITAFQVIANHIIDNRAPVTVGLKNFCS